MILGAVRTELTSELIGKKGENLKLKGDPNNKGNSYVSCLFYF